MQPGRNPISLKQFVIHYLPLDSLFPALEANTAICYPGMVSLRNNLVLGLRQNLSFTPTVRYLGFIQCVLDTLDISRDHR